VSLLRRERADPPRCSHGPAGRPIPVWHATPCRHRLSRRRCLCTRNCSRRRWRRPD